MIDVENLRIGDPAMDIAVLAVWVPSAVPAIMAGFAAEGGVIDDVFVRRMRYYTTVRTLAAAEWHRDELGDERTAAALLDGLEASGASSDSPPDGGRISSPLGR